ncbi:MAG: cobalamin biosynthesis protein CobQ [Paracoccaceae bacterium]
MRWVPHAAVLGGLAPDVSLYLMASWAMYVQHIPARTVFRELYFSPSWQNVFAVDNSFFLWGLVLMLAIWRQMPCLTAFTGAGFVHLCCDFPLHNEDARRQFWPISDYVFRSPLSYYNPVRYGNIIGPLEMALCVVLSVVLWRRFTSKGARILIALALATEVVPGVLFRYMLHRH